jgi:hypothetical protein
MPGRRCGAVGPSPATAAGSETIELSVAERLSDVARPLHLNAALDIPSSRGNDE